MAVGGLDGDFHLLEGGLDDDFAGFLTAQQADAAGVHEGVGAARHSASALTRSRVTPGWLWTMAMRLPDNAVEEGGLADIGAADDGDQI